MDIVIIGTGNTATILGKRLKGAGHKILQIVGRDRSAASLLADALDADASSNRGPITDAAELCILAVSDAAITPIVNQLPFPANAILVHTAASVSLDVLKGKAANIGVFYPLQSLKKEVEALPEIPIVIDANNEGTLQQLNVLAQTITHHIYTANDEQRLRLHMAAVMVNNFTNHLYTLVEDYCNKEGLDFHLLQPLIRETASRLKEISPSFAQTGPAVRNDSATIDKHLALLEHYSQLKKMYQLFTESIQQHR
ncbi:MAG TPA: DUF2520 domain-containing protein [Flavisolibacter sp.]|jgi:predicted short-subunit dehydrogenase-like oxidoreductase (DUF2520 family)|nr:DUF2520 domain-containing protein [Flavisolibacter sp.]